MSTPQCQTIRFEKESDNCLVIHLSGRLDHREVAHLWHAVHKKINRTLPGEIVIDGAELKYCDASGVCLLRSIADLMKKNGKPCRLRTFKSHIQYQFELSWPRAPLDGTCQTMGQCINGFIENVGRQIVTWWRDLIWHIEFLGHVTASLGAIFVFPLKLRWKDTFWLIQAAGVQAFGIIMLVSLLLGLILAFQAAIPLRQFGAQIFVADLVALSVSRELGPLLTAIILAGRTGSAFAAELGTMKVNEELNALSTMGLDPIRFLVAPRILAALLVTPLLSIFSVLFALVGAAIVMKTLGFTMVAYLNQVQNAISMTDIWGGLFKALFFGLLVAAIGCRRGMQTGMGARAVGQSATSAVVTGIFLILVADGLFAVIYFILGI